MNKVMLVGTIDGDVTVKSVGNSQVANFRVCTTDTYLGRDGQPTSSQQWHSISAWGKVATLCERLNRGQLVAVDGSLRHRSYEAKGEKKYVTEVSANNVSVLSAESARGAGNGSGRPRQDDQRSRHDDELPF